MYASLTTPKQTVSINRAKIVALKMENNPFLGTRWMDIFVVYCSETEQYSEPGTGALAQHYRIESGRNPHAQQIYFGQTPNSSDHALGLCDVCETWHNKAGGACQEDGCEGTIQPYDGLDRLCGHTPEQGVCCAEAIFGSLYDFLTNEMVPDPETGELKLLLDASVVEEE